MRRERWRRPRFQSSLKRVRVTIEQIPDRDSLPLFDNATLERRSPKRLRYDDFIAGRSDVWDWFCEFAFQAHDIGKERFSARTIVHRIRWEVMLQGRDDQGFKINNDWSPFLARDFMRLYPECDGLFELREQTTANPTE